MPLAFSSINKGEVAFGFFNVETDMLLLDRFFFFADDFCNFIGIIAERGKEPTFEFTFPVFYIDDNRKVGNLIGAIYGLCFSGFIGDVYRQFPFPREQRDFRQKPDGLKNRKLVEKLISRYSQKKEIVVAAVAEFSKVQIGDLFFSKDVFQQLILYIWVGGYPRWKDGERPNYVKVMKEKIERSDSWLFNGIRFLENASKG